MNPLRLIKRLLGRGVEPSQIRRPGSVSRRDFLRVCGVTSVTVAMPGLLLSKGGIATKPEYFMGVDWADRSKGITRNEQRILNEAVFDRLCRSDPVAEKKAIDAVNNFTRMRMREGGFYRRIMPLVPTRNNELDFVTEHQNAPFLDESDDVDKLDRGMSDPAAMSIPFGMLPKDTYIRGPRYSVMFDRIVTPKFAADVEAKKIWSVPSLLSDPAVSDNAHFKLTVEGTDDNAKVAAAVSRRFDDRPATPEQIEKFLADLLTRRSTRRPCSGQMGSRGPVSRPTVSLRRRAIHTA